MEQLKPCPFCGGEAYMRMRRAYAGTGRSWYACCSKCYAKTDGYEEPGDIENSLNPFAVLEETIADAAALWNARVQEQAQSETPVIHAHWISDNYDVMCSHCDARYENDIVNTPINQHGATIFAGLEHCPHCGAIMDEAEHECGPDYCELEADDD